MFKRFKMKPKAIILLLIFSFTLPLPISSADDIDVKIIQIQQAWAKNSINMVPFRREAITTSGENQYVTFYNKKGQVIIAKRKHITRKWQFGYPGFSGNVVDAHNSISFILDTNGYIHLSWDHHSSPLRYSRSSEPGNLTYFARETSMLGQNENRVTYPQFFKSDEGSTLYFLYRNGRSGAGDIFLNRYNVKKKEWLSVAAPLISGEGKRSAYTDGLAIDKKGVLHISWIWRETNNVASNHDICYARSSDGGKTWTDSNGRVYELPITINNAETILRVPMKNNLMNQGSIEVNTNGNPYIVNYWNDTNGIPQYYLIWHDKGKWHKTKISNRKTRFNLDGGGTKKVPISRPSIAIAQDSTVHVIFRDVERGNRISVASSKNKNYKKWIYYDLTSFSVKQWEPNYDRIFWRKSGKLHILGQRVGQGDGESLENIEPTSLFIVEWIPS